jgi:hypothetical protein
MYERQLLKKLCLLSKSFTLKSQTTGVVPRNPRDPAAEKNVFGLAVKPISQPNLRISAFG